MLFVIFYFSFIVQVLAQCAWLTASLNSPSAHTIMQACCRLPHQSIHLRLSVRMLRGLPAHLHAWPNALTHTRPPPRTHGRPLGCSHGRPLACSHGRPLACLHGCPLACSHGCPPPRTHASPLEWWHGRRPAYVVTHTRTHAHTHAHNMIDNRCHIKDEMQGCMHVVATNV